MYSVNDPVVSQSNSVQTTRSGWTGIDREGINPDAKSLPIPSWQPTNLAKCRRRQLDSI